MPSDVGQLKALGTKTPNFFIVGAAKCGTSALNEYLSTHPDVFCAAKELHYFGSDLDFGTQVYRRNFAGYMAEFDACKTEPCVGEASVWYLLSQKAAAEIKAFNADARIIIMLREPVSMMYSLFHQFTFDGNEPLSSFEAALAMETERRAGRGFGRQTYFKQALCYRAAASYTEQVRRYFDHFNRDQIHVVIYDDFARDTAGTYQKVLDFLGIRPDRPSTEVDFRIINGNKKVKSRALRALAQDPMVRGTAIAMRKWLPKPAFQLMQKLGVLINNYNTRPDKRCPCSPELRLSLQREFAPEIERLSELLGRDLTHWSHPDRSDLSDASQLT